MHSADGEDWNRVIKHWALRRKIIYINLKQSSELSLNKTKHTKKSHLSVKHPNVQVYEGEMQHLSQTFSAIPWSFQVGAYLL